MKKSPSPKKGWESVSRWYGGIVGEKGHYYHRQIVLPKALELLGIKGQSPVKLLDLACGQGVLARQLPPNVEYWGVDLAPSLIKEAKKQAKGISHQHFQVADVSKPLDHLPTDFDWVTVILAIQDIENMAATLDNAWSHLKKGGQLLIILNHPCFRIPRQSHWGVDEEQKRQYRRLDSYMSPMVIPIHTKPSKGQHSPVVKTHHRPLSTYFQALGKAGFVVKGLHEWVSDKRSTGSKAAMENRARKEFPLFLAILAEKPV